MNILNDFIIKTQSTKNLSSKTITAYKSDIKDFIYYIRKPVETTSISNIYEYIDALNKRGLKDTTIKRKIISLKLFYSFLYNEKVILGNPFFGVKFSFRQEKRLPKTLTVKEVSRLLATLHENALNAKTSFSIFEATRDICLLDLLISTGIRIGEAAKITLSDLIIQEHTILIHGKGRKQRLIYISCQETWEHLKEWMRLRKTYNPSSNYLFFKSSICSAFYIYYLKYFQ